MTLSVKIAPLSSRKILALEGVDRFAFLQGLVSNDMKLAQEGKPLFAALLTPQGKFLFDLFIIPDGEKLLIDCEASRADELQIRLMQFKLRSTITLSAISLAVYALWGDTPSNLSAFADPRLGALGYRQISATPIAATAAEDDYRAHRYALGVAEGSTEIDVGNATLLELNFDMLNGVSFTKGCYMGQELTARTHYRGLIKKRYLPFAYEGTPPQKGQIITSNGIELGEVKASANGYGLGLFSLERVKALSAAPTPPCRIFIPAHLAGVTG